MSKENHKHGVIDQVKQRKRPSKRKWIDGEYHVHDNADVSHKYTKMYCDTNQFPELTFCGPHPKPHGARGLSEHYHLRLIQKQVMAYVNFATYHVPVLDVHQFWIYLGFLVFRKIIRHATNLSPTVLIGHFWAHIKIVILSR